MAIPISAYMLTFNNARTVELALKSLSFADEIVVVDSGSSDGTLDIVRRYAAKVIERPWPGFREQYQFAANQCSHEWVFFLDADEEVDPLLAEEIRRTLEANAARPEAEQVRGYHGHRRTFYLDRWILHGGWIPDYELRLYHRRFGTWKGDLHAKIHVAERHGHFRHFIYHYTYQNISDQLHTIDNYSTTAAEDMERAGKRFSYLRLLGNPCVRFLKEYFLKGGCRDGFPGLVIAVNTAFYVFNKHAKLWERRHCTPEVIRRAQEQKPR